MFILPAGSLAWYGGLIELSLGFLFLVGYQARVVALFLSGEMAVAYFTTHLRNGFFPTENGGYAVAVYCFVFFYFVAAGSGPLLTQSWEGIERRFAEVALPTIFALATPPDGRRRSFGHTELS